MVKKEKLRILIATLSVFALMLVQCTTTMNTQSSKNYGETRKITFASLIGSEDQYQELIREFETQNPTIDIQYIPLQTKSPDLNELVGQVDVIFLNRAISTTEDHLFLDLDPLMSSLNFDADILWPNALSGCQIDGRQKGMPISISPNLIFFNKTMFDRVRLPYPQPGWTWDDFRSAIHTLSDPTVPSPRYGFFDSGTASVLNSQIDAALRVGQGADALASSVTWYVEMAKAGEIAIPNVNVEADRSTLIKNGQVAMWAGPLSTLFYDDQGFDFAIGVVPFPADLQNPFTNPMNLVCAVISAGTSQPVDSWVWLDFLNHTPLPDEKGDSVSANVEVANASQYWQTSNTEVVGAVRFALEHAWYGWVHRDLSSVRDSVETSINSGDDLADLLRRELNKISAETTPPASQTTPVPVVPPSSTSTSESEKSDGTLSAVYYVDRYYHNNVNNVITLAEEFNSTHQNMRIEIAKQRVGFENIPSNIYDVNNFDCFAAPGAVISTSDISIEFTEKVYTLDPLLDTSDSNSLVDLNPVLVDAARIAGSLYGLPVAVRPYIVYYNATLFQKLGLEKPSLDWTVKDFWSFAAQAAKESNDVYGYVPYGNDPLYYFSEAKYLDVNSPYPRADFENPDLIVLLNQLVPLAKERALFIYDSGGSRSHTGNYQERDDQINSGTGAMWIDQIGMPKSPQSTLPYQVGVAMFPMQQTLNPAYSTSLYISKRAQNPEVCWTWFEFLVNQQSNVFSGIPLSPATINSENWAASVGQDQAAVYRTTLSNLVFTEKTNNFPPLPLSQWWADAMAAVLQEGREASTVLHEIQFKAQNTLDCIQASGIPASIPYDLTYEVAIRCAKTADPSYQK